MNLNNGTNYIAKFELFRKKMAWVSPDYNRKKYGVLYITAAITVMSLLTLLISFPNVFTLDYQTTVTQVYAQPYVETVKHKDLTIDLGYAASHEHSKFVI